MRKSPKRWESPYVAMITAAAERMLFWRRVKSDWPFLKSCRMCDIIIATNAYYYKCHQKTAGRQAEEGAKLEGQKHAEGGCG